MEYQSLNPSNSRIVIYHKDKQNVKFEYPIKLNAFRVCFFTFLQPWIIINVIITIIVLIVSIIINSTTKGYFFYSSYSEFFSVVYLAYLICLELLFIPLFTAVLFSTNPKLLRFMPEISKRLHMITSNHYYYRKIERINNKIFEIPIFDNIFLDYRATGEFSKYLFKVEIREHDLRMIKMRYFSTKIKDEGSQDRLWYAQFHFEKIPRYGYLEVWFK